MRVEPLGSLDLECWQAFRKLFAPTVYSYHINVRFSAYYCRLINYNYPYIGRIEWMPADGYLSLCRSTGPFCTRYIVRYRYKGAYDQNGMSPLHG